MRRSYAEQRVRILSLVQKANQDRLSLSLVLVFPDNVEFSGIDMNIFKEIYVLLLGVNSQFSMVCGASASLKLRSFNRTQSISIYPSLSEALIKTKPQYLMTYPTKLTRNLIVMDSDTQQLDALVLALLIDRFSAVGVSTFDETLDYITKFGDVLDGAILRFNYPSFKEVELVSLLRKVKPDAKILIHSEVLDANILKICQDFKITSIIKSPFKTNNLIRKYKSEFPERQTNYLGLPKK